MTSLGQLALVLACGLAGPLIAGASRNLVPLVIGEILAGVIIGVSGFGIVDATDPALSLLETIGFATLMFAVGMRIPLHDRRLRGALGRGALAAAAGGIAAIPAALAAAAIGDMSHPAVIGVVIASSSAAVALPILDERGLISTETLPLIAQITIADIAAVLAVPFALEPGRAGTVALASLAVVATALVFFGAMRLVLRMEWYRRLRRQSKERGWALDLRVALAALVALAWLAQDLGTSVLIAGFATGLIVAAIGGPERLSLEVRGVGEGFLVPVFFVLLGTKLNVRDLFSDPSNLALAGSMAALNAGVHLVAALASRQRPAAGLVATAELGVPAAVAALGLSEHVLNAGQAAAIVAAALVSVGICSAGAALLEARARRPSPSRRAHASG
jgi:Kef-type K+ transport system membrane component KefB